MNNLFESNLLSTQQKDKINKGLYQSLYVLEKIVTDSGDMEFKMTGSTLNIYTVKIINLDITCDCPDTDSDTYCKHICFIICAVGKLTSENIF